MEKSTNTSCTVQLIGSKGPQSDFLRSFLATELKCFVVGKKSYALSGQKKTKIELILINCLNESYGCLKAEFLRQSDENSVVVLLNFPRDRENDELDAILLGIRGVFYCGDSPEVISRGLKAILEGELWFSRKIMSRCLISGVISSGSVDSSAIPEELTFREQEILSMLKQGYTNMNIGSRLGISTHTVKTHVYNTYKKINVSNRVQAIRWADQYISCL